VFLTPKSVSIFFLGAVSFSIANASGVIGSAICAGILWSFMIVL
jgi:Na+-transporting methylmalonyl-CoA/oxaloacetate decarboxylase beta subunit